MDLSPLTPVTLEIAGSSRRFPVRRVYCVGRNYLAHVREMREGADERDARPRAGGVLRAGEGEARQGLTTMIVGPSKEPSRNALRRRRKVSPALQRRVCKSQSLDRSPIGTVPEFRAIPSFCQKSKKTNA